MWTLKGRRALVTGGSKGIGKAVVKELLDLGAEVIFTARQKTDISALEEELSGQPVKGLVSDVADPAARRELAGFIEEHFGGLDILVHNAGINIRKPALEYDEEEFRKVLEVNLISPFELSRLCFPLLKRGTHPSVINVASVAASVDVRSGAPYGMAKSGLLQQTRSLAVEWAADGIRVNAVSPWYTVTPLTEKLLEQPDRIEPVLQCTPMKRVASPEEMSGVIAFLAMDKASYITGQNIIVDGGMTVSAF